MTHITPSTPTLKPNVTSGLTIHVKSETGLELNITTLTDMRRAQL